VCNCGGILELREIAAMAEVYHVVVSPHNYNSTAIGLAATVHAAAGMPNFLITEYFVNFEEVGKAIATPLVPENGMIALPTAPGLGVEIDEDALAHYAYQEFPKRNLRRPVDEAPI
jgi:galactonate dehydratase